MISYQDIEFKSGDSACSGWFLRAKRDQEKPGPCVILAHGFCGVKEACLDAYAERFADAGYHALVFDYRHFGSSPGSPRQLLDIKKQQQDWHAAISYARALAEVDPARIILWGTSFSGGHVVEVAVKDGKIAAVISQVPHMSGPATVMAAGTLQGARLGMAAVRDLLRAAAGRRPFYIPAFGRPGELAAMTAPGAYEASRRIFPEDKEVDESVAARVFLSVPFYSPGRLAARLSAPWLVQVAEFDQTTPVGPAAKAAEKTRGAELITYPLGHFDMYVEPHFERTIGDQLDFLKRRLSGASSSGNVSAGLV